MPEYHPTKSQTEIATEVFVDRIKEIHPQLDREEFYDAINRCVQDAVVEANSQEAQNDAARQHGREHP